MFVSIRVRLKTEENIILETLPPLPANYLVRCDDARTSATRPSAPDLTGTRPLFMIVITLYQHLAMVVFIFRFLNAVSPWVTEIHTVIRREPLLKAWSIDFAHVEMVGWWVGGRWAAGQADPPSPDLWPSPFNFGNLSESEFMAPLDKGAILYFFNSIVFRIRTAYLHSFFSFTIGLFKSINASCKCEITHVKFFTNVVRVTFGNMLSSN